MSFFAARASGMVKFFCGIAVVGMTVVVGVVSAEFSIKKGGVPGVGSAHCHPFSVS